MRSIKENMRLLFSSASVPARQDFHAVLYNDLKYVTRRNVLTETLLHDEAPGITADHSLDHDIVVSLTSYGRRIHEVALTIESLMQQTMKANRIVLWLAEDLAGQELPKALVLQQKRGLEIKYCKDIRSYKKLIPQLKESPDDAIITADDDVLYDYDVLEHLIMAHQKQPEQILCCRARIILFDNNGSLLPYNQWPLVSREEGREARLFLTGIGGILYPPHCFDEEVFNERVFLSLCPNADDAWFTAMAINKGITINKVFTRDEYGEDYISIPSPLEQGLAAREK